MWFRTLACWIDTFDRNLIKKGEEEEKEDKDKNRSGVRDLWRVVWGWVKDVSGWVFAAVLFVLAWLHNDVPPAMRAFCSSRPRSSTSSGSSTSTGTSSRRNRSNNTILPF
ncbi:hypothetical protein PG989_000589 [Apiospora arundinis]